MPLFDRLFWKLVRHEELDGSRLGAAPTSYALGAYANSDQVLYRVGADAPGSSRATSLQRRKQKGSDSRLMSAAVIVVYDRRSRHCLWNSQPHALGNVPVRMCVRIGESGSRLVT
jgi:hypothetical protein